MAKLAAGQIIMPYLVNNAQFGVHIVFPNGTDSRSLKKLLIREFKIQTGRTLSNNEITRSGVLANMTLEKDAFYGEDQAQGHTPDENEIGEITDIPMSAVSG